MVSSSRLLLPLVLCLGLGVLVLSAGSSGLRKRGPSVTAKVTERQAATSPTVGQKDGGALETGSFVSGIEEEAEDGRQRAGLVRGDCLRHGGRGHSPR